MSCVYEMCVCVGLCVCVCVMKMRVSRFCFLKASIRRRRECGSYEDLEDEEEEVEEEE